MFKSLVPVIAAALMLGACSQPPPQAAAPVQRVVPPGEVPPMTVYFDTGRSTLSAQAASVVQGAATVYKRQGNARVTLTGHADTTGSPNSNMTLSQRRADAVKDGLVRDGVPAAAISTVGQGEATLPVQTADNVAEPRNRSVDISIVRIGGMSDAEYCAALSAKYREYRPSQIDEEAAAAMAKCEAGNTAAGIPVLERHLTNAKIALPSRT
jgi:hypothetical protein